MTTKQILNTAILAAKEDTKLYARWFCDVVTPYCPEGELGDVYVVDITSVARRIR